MVPADGPRDDARVIRRALPTALAALAAACSQHGDTFTRPERPPERIVAGSVLAAETLLAIAPRERIAAVHRFAADPGYSLVAGQVGELPLVGAEPEELMSARPDLVIVDAFTKPETLAILASAEVPVLRTATPQSFADVAANLRAIGSACHLEAAAEDLVRRMQQRLAELEVRGRELDGWRILRLDGAFYTYGRGSLFDAVVNAAGARNLAAEHGAGPFRKLTLESTLAMRPEVLVIDTVSGSTDSERAWIEQTAGLGLVPAVQNDRIVFVAKALFGTTSHRLVDTVEYLQDALLSWGPK